MDTTNSVGILYNTYNKTKNPFTDIIHNNYRKVTSNIVTAAAFLEHEK
jgi:hypothetical protein